MIFELDKSLVDYHDSSRLVKVLLKMSEQGHHVLISDQSLLYKIQELLLDTRFCSSEDCKLIMANQSFWDCNQELQKYLRTITIGSNSDSQHTIEMVEEMLESPSYVFVENGIYDWTALERWIKVKTKSRKFSTINTLVYRMSQRQAILSFHCGGTGQIADHVEAQQHRLFPHTIHLKSMVVLDSDKTSLEDTSKHTPIINRLRHLGVDVHELYKRELENYFPLECFWECGKANRSASFSPAEYDFIDIEHHPMFNYTKSDITDLARKLRLKQLENRVAHHKNSNDIDEIQEIIFKFAKII